MTGRILGAVLAGGASSRFGSDKALATSFGRTLLDLACAALTPWVATVMTIGRDGGVPDLPGPGLGPLGGIAGALAWARERGFDSVLSMGCDMPAVPAALLRELRETAPSYCAEAPVLGHWPIQATDVLLALLADATSPIAPQSRIADIGSEHRTGEVSEKVSFRPSVGTKNSALSVRRWARSIGATAIGAPTSPLRNVNTPADLPA